jgi:hypothetical protein
LLMNAWRGQTRRQRQLADERLVRPDEACKGAQKATLMTTASPPIATWR